MVFSSLNAVLLVILLTIFAGIPIRCHACTRSGLLFALLLLANSVLTAFSYAMLSPI